MEFLFRVSKIDLSLNTLIREVIDTISVSVNYPDYLYSWLIHFFSPKIRSLVKRYLGNIQQRVIVTAVQYLKNLWLCKIE